MELYAKKRALLHVNFKDQQGCWGNPRRNANCNNDFNCSNINYKATLEEVGKKVVDLRNLNNNILSNTIMLK